MRSSSDHRVSTSRLRALDGLRAIAALTVVAYHVALAGSLSRTGPLAPLFAELKAGVAVFFVISGLVLFMPYAQALHRREPLPDWRAYLNRRAVRILPAYWTALTVLALSPLRSSVIGPEAWRYYALAQIYHGDTVMGGLGVAWSLCVEVTFYAALPFFAVALRWLLRRRAGAAALWIELGVLGMLALGTIALRLALAGSAFTAVPHAGYVLVTALPGFLDWFAVGMGLAVLAAAWAHGSRALPWLAALARRPGCCWALAVSLFAASGFIQGGDLFLSLYGCVPHVTTGVAAGLVVLPALAHEASGRRRLLGVLTQPMMVWLGAVSYGIYLWHGPVLQAINGGLAPAPTAAGAGHVLGLFVVVAAVAVGLGAASWYVIEQPARRLVSRPQRAAHAPAAG